MPFPKGFFGSPYSGTWKYAFALPDSRIASAEFFVTNDRGNSEPAAACLTQTTDCGLRTLSSGQFSIQVNGYLAVDSNAAPDLVIEAAHAIRDVFAVVRQAPSGGPVQMAIRQDGADYCTLTIPAGATASDSINGLTLGTLNAGARLSLAITAVGETDSGFDLTVVIRL